jgi:protein LTV1
MGKKKKQFIDKKTAATFQIVQRRQGGNYDGETVTGSKYMLQPARYDTPLPADFPLDLLQVPAHATAFRKVVDKRENKEDSEGDDEYDYEQHFRSIGDQGLDSGSAVFIQNPSAPAMDIRQKVVAVEAKEDDSEGRLFTKAIKPERTGKLKISADLAKALDGAEGFDELDDDFVLTAIHDQKDFENREEEEDFEGDLFDEGDTLSEAEEGDFEDEGDEGDERTVAQPPIKPSKKPESLAPKSIPGLIPAKGTSKGILKSSEVPKKTSQHSALYDEEGDEYEGDEGDEEEEEDDTEVNGRPKRMIDAQFDSLLAQYDDDQDIGELDPDNPELLGGVENIDDYAKEITEFTSRQDREYGGEQAIPLTDSEKLIVIEKLEVQAAEGEEPIATTHAKIDAMFPVTEKENWDCESIVSTYSNTENHPLLIKRPSKFSSKPIKLSGKTGIPIGYFPTREKPEDVPEEEEDEGDGESRGNLGAARNKEETKTEKQARKKEIKAARREARGRKKDLKLQYSAELSRQLHFDHHQQLHNPPVTKM